MNVNTVETGQTSFSAHFKSAAYWKEFLPGIATEVDTELNYQRVILEAQAILQGRIEEGI